MGRGKKNIQGNQNATEQPGSLAIAAKGITTGQDFAALMSTLMSDLISGNVSPGIGNAVCNAGGKLLKVVEMQFKYGTLQQTDGSRILLLTQAKNPFPTQPQPQA